MAKNIQAGKIKMSDVKPLANFVSESIDLLLRTTKHLCHLFDILSAQKCVN